MEYLNSLDLDTKKRSHRVRSWYLYEQYKSLEKNQLDAANRLKDKSYQEKILRQELFERKARRKLYDQFGSCHSEPGKEGSLKSNDNKTTLSASADDFFESFCELHEDENITQVTSSNDSFSQDDSVILKSFTEDFESVQEKKDDNSYAGSVQSVIENTKSRDNLEETLMGSFVGDDLNSQLEEAKENIECIEKFIELSDIEKASASDSGSEHTIEYKPKHIVTENRRPKKPNNNNVFAVWSRLVSFAYQIIKINHGNCYYDYSSQFLTAVLACDVLRRGISRICHILQPYVSPIKFATDDESETSTEYHKNVKRPSKILKKYRKAFGCKKMPCHKANVTKKYWSEDCWRQKSKSSLKKLVNKQKSRWASEPWRSSPQFNNTEDSSEHSSCSIWPEFSKENMFRRKHLYNCSCCKRFRNPMLKIAQYIDNILKDLGDCY